MTTIIPTPAPVPDPLSSDFGTKAYDFTVWMAQAAPAMTAVAQETNDALNASLLSVTAASTSSIAIVSSGNVNLTVTPNKGYAIGMTVKIASVANPVNYIKGTVTAFTSSTGAMTVAVFNKGGSGTFASWSVFFDVPDPSVLSVPTGEVVAAGNLLAEDGAGNSMSAGTITTAVLQAVTATSLHACPLVNTNTAIFWTAGTTDLRLAIYGKFGGLILASTSVATCLNSSLVWSAELTNGNIVLVYFNASSQAVFKVVSAAGAPVVSETVIEAVTCNGQIKCCALTGGGFAVTYNVAANNRYAIYTNAGGVTKAATTNVSGAQTRVAICPTAAGGFIALAGVGNSTLSGFIYGASGNPVAASALVPPNSDSVDVNIASKSGSSASTGRYSGATPYCGVICLASDSVQSVINSPGTTGSFAQLVPTFSDASSVFSNLGVGHIGVLGDGNYIATISALSASEYPRYVIFNELGQMIRSGILFSETNYPSANIPVFVIPKDTNGFSLIWLAANQNIKFAQIKTGKIVGVSLGAVGATHQYLAAGEVTLSSTNMLNVGSSKVNYSRQGTKVVI